MLRVLDAYIGGEGSQRQLGARFRVSLSFVRNLLRLARQTGGLAPRPRCGGHRSTLDAQAMRALVPLVRPTPDAIYTRFTSTRVERLTCANASLAVHTVHLHARGEAFS
jgi:transposase